MARGYRVAEHVLALVGGPNLTQEQGNPDRGTQGLFVGAEPYGLNVGNGRISDIRT